jgi:hypothetical protein
LLCAEAHLKYANTEEVPGVNAKSSVLLKLAADASTLNSQFPSSTEVASLHANDEVTAGWKVIFRGTTVAVGMDAGNEAPVEDIVAVIVP